MYANDVKADILNDLKKGSSIYSDDNLNKITRKFLNELDQCQHFHMGKIEDIKSLYKMHSIETPGAPFTGPFMGEMARDVNRPYDMCWFDCDIMIGENGDIPASVGAIVMSLHTDEDISRNRKTGDSSIVFIEAAFKVLNSPWTISPASLIYKVGESFSREESKTILAMSFMPEPEKDDVEERRQYNDNVERVMATNVYTIPNIYELDRYIDDGYKSYFEISGALVRELVPAINIFLFALNCKNIYTEDTYHKKRIMKRGKFKWIDNKFKYVFKTLKFKLPKSRKKTAQSEGIGSSKSVHLCMGHFKTYTEDAPLLGKHTGRWWWGSQKRGGDETSLTEKNYLTEY